DLVLVERLHFRRYASTIGGEALPIAVPVRGILHIEADLAILAIKALAALHQERFERIAVARGIADSPDAFLAARLGHLDAEAGTVIPGRAAPGRRQARFFERLSVVEQGEGVV